MYKLHKILQRFLCRMPIDSKQGAPGPPARLCAMVHVYPYPGTPTPIPMVPHAYCLHTYMHWYICFIYLFILLSLSLFILLSLSLLLFSSLSFCLLSLSPCPWQGLPLGRGSRSYLSCMRQCFILFNYYPAVHMYGMWVCIYMYCIVYVYVSSIIHVSNRCMYVHSVVCIVHAALCMCSSIHAVLCSMDYLCIVYP